MDECPDIIKEYLFYMKTIQGRSENTVDGYYIDLRTFFRFIKQQKNLVSTDTSFEEIKISDVDIELIRSVTLMDVYQYLDYLQSERQNSPVTRSRKISVLKSFFKYLTKKSGLLTYNPIQELEVPSTKKALPKYLSLEQCLEMLNKIDGSNKERDYCIITLFLNCGMRLSELVGLNLGDIKDNTIKVLGKGNKERIIYLNNAALDALDRHLKLRYKQKNVKDRYAMFITRGGTRISRRRVQEIVENCLKAIGLDHMGFSTHKLRHTCATLMYQYGEVDIRTLKDFLGHERISTTEIYTHVSNKQLEQASAKSPLSNIKKREP